MIKKFPAILILSSHLHLRQPSESFLSGFPTTTVDTGEDCTKKHDGQIPYLSTIYSHLPILFDAV